MKNAPEDTSPEGEPYSMHICRVNNVTRTSEASIWQPPSRGYSIVNDPSESSCDPLRVLIPITNGCLIIGAIIFILALAIVALIVMMAIIKVYFMKGDFDSIWTDSSWFW